MLTNAVSSAVGRLYAGAVAEAPRLQVQRVEPVARVSVAAPGRAADHGERQQAAQNRHALTDGVRAVFESTAGIESTSSAAQATDGVTGATEALSAQAASKPSSAMPDPADPLLEEAILRFIHAVFRSIADAEGPAGAAELPPLAGAPTANIAEDLKTHLPGFNASREVLGGRIDALAQRLAQAGAASDPLDGDETSAKTGSSTDAVAQAETLLASGGANQSAIQQSSGELGKAFAAVVQALGGAGDESSSIERPTRGNLVTLMHRLAQAMQGAPPLDEGLPTVGGLLHARA